MNWHIGQEIVCIKTHTTGVIKRGQIFTINGLRNGICNCSPIQIDVGIKVKADYDTCSRCKVAVRSSCDSWFFHEELFATLEYDQQAIDELLEQPIYVEK